MGDIVMATGATGRKYAQRGAAKANAARGARLYRVDGEVLTLAQIQARLAGSPMGSVSRNLAISALRERQRKGPLSWESLRAYKPQEKRE